MPKLLLLLLALATMGVAPARAQGPAGAESEPNRMQPWLVPTPLPDTMSHALVYRPAGEGPFPLAVIAHATTQNVLRRAQMPQPQYRALASWLVARGYAVLVRSGLAMAGPADDTSRTKAAATRPIMSVPDRRPPTRSPRRW